MGTLLTTRQAGQHLGVSALRVRQFITEGRLRAIKPGHEYLIDQDDLDVFQRRPTGRPRTAHRQNLRTAAGEL